MGIILLKEIINIVCSTKVIEPELFGTLRRTINNDIAVYESNHKPIETIIAYYKKGSLIKLGFAGKMFAISLIDIVEFLGDYKLAYNYRDNFTQFCFRTNSQDYRIERILFRKDNNIEYNNTSNSFKETTPQGVETSYNAEYITFNSFTLEFMSGS